MQDRTRPAPYGTAPGNDFWQKRLEDECARAAQGGKPFVLLLIRPAAGESAAHSPVPHSSGALGLVVEGLRRGIRTYDALCRLSPGSIGVLLIECNATQAPAIAKRLVSLAERELARSLPAGMLPPLESGWATCPEDASSPAALMQRAQAALLGEPRRPAVAAPSGPALAATANVRHRLFGLHWGSASHGAVRS